MGGDDGACPRIPRSSCAQHGERERVRSSVVTMEYRTTRPKDLVELDTGHAYRHVVLAVAPMLAGVGVSL